MLTKINQNTQEELNKILLDDNGYVKKKTYEELLNLFSKYEYDQFRVWCCNQGIYQYPTIELLKWLKTKCQAYGKENCLEIGAGNNLIYDFLGIRGTDSFLQQQPKIKIYYEKALKHRATCGNPKPNLIKISAEKAIKKYKPKLVIGAWVTPKWDDQMQAGNYYGPDYKKIIKNCHEFVMVGNEAIHGELVEKFRPQKIYIYGLISRSAYPKCNCIYIFKNKLVSSF